MVKLLFSIPENEMKLFSARQRNCASGTLLSVLVTFWSLLPSK